MPGYIELKSVVEKDGVMYGEPAAEYAPVIHAHWITIHRVDGTKADKCSNCGGGVKYFYYKYNWCPHCSAKMDEEEPQNEVFL